MGDAGLHGRAPRRAAVTGALLVLIGWAHATSAVAAPVAVQRLETDAAVRPLGIDNPEPRLGWRLSATRRDVRQTAYRVVVARSAERAAGGQGDVWDSGRVESARPWADYDGPPLESRTRYFWSVRTWDERGTPTAWAPPSWFETAFMSPEEWRAEWITGPPSATANACGIQPVSPRRCAAPAPLLRTGSTCRRRWRMRACT